MTQWRTEQCTREALGPLRFAWDVPTDLEACEAPPTAARDDYFQEVRRLHHEADAATLTLNFAMMGTDHDPVDIATIALESAGLRVAQYRRLENRDVEIYSELASESESVFCHSRILRDCTRFIRVDAWVGAETPSSRRKDLLAAMHSFRLLNPGAPAEQPPREAGVAGANGEVHFQYPVGWRLERDHPDDGGSSRVMLLHPKSERILAEVEVARSTHTDLAQACRARAADLESEGLQLSGAPIVALEPPEGCTAGVLHSPAATFAGRPVSCGTIALQHPSGIVTIGVRGIGRQDHPLLWATIRRTAHVVMESLVAAQPA